MEYNSIIHKTSLTCPCFCSVQKTLKIFQTQGDFYTGNSMLLRLLDRLYIELPGVARKKHFRSDLPGDKC